jgi:hypothetical protein
MKRKSLFICLWFLCSAFSGFAQDALTITDGPYVFYHDNQIQVTIIEKDDNLLRPKTISYATGDKSDIVLNVIPEGHAEWSFTVKLKNQIENEIAVTLSTDKTLFVSDIEGEFAHFRKMLLAAKIIDEQYHWTYGTGRLVVAGDLFDRGKDVVPELWLLYKLEDEAKAAGGSLQTELGNHCIMNLSGDNRYTDAKYFKNARLLKTDCTNLFGKDTELGRWLRSKNVIEKTGDVLVMHGGLSPAILGRKLSIEQMNAACQPYYGLSRTKLPDSAKLFFGKDALFWYRGYFLAPKITLSQLDSTLNIYGCKYIVVGHTIVKWNIASYLSGKIIGVDVDYHNAQVAAALYENGKWYVINASGKTTPLIYKAENDIIKESDIL